MTRRTSPLLTLLALAATAACATPARADVTRAQAADLAVAALGAAERTTPVIVFAERTPVRAGARISEAGLGLGAGSGPVDGAARAAGVVRRGAPLLLRGGNERSWLFYEDRGPSLAFAHAGRVALVGTRTGRVRLSPMLRWVPTVDGRRPSFLRSAAAYAAPANRVLYRPWGERTAPTAAAAADAGPPAPASAAAPTLAGGQAEQRLADLLAADGGCALRVSDTLGDLYDFGAVDRTRARLGGLLQGLEHRNRGFRDERYTVAGGRTVPAAMQRLVDGGCRSMLLYLAGGADPSGAGSVVAGVRPVGDDVLVHRVTAAALGRVIAANPGVRFQVVVDAPGARRTFARLGALPNVTALVGPAGDTSFTFLPEARRGGRLTRNAANPDGLLELTNRLLVGLARFATSPAEVAHAGGERAGGRSPATLAWWLARASALSGDAAFADGVGTPPRVLTLGFTATAPSSAPVVPPALQQPVWVPAPAAEQPAPSTAPTEPQRPAPEPDPAPAPNTPPSATAATLTTAEDTPLPLTLPATDADGDPLTYAVVGQPAHGTLTGAGAARIYTPAQDWSGGDELTFTASDGKATTAVTKVTLDVTAVNDPPVVTTTSAPGAMTEGNTSFKLDEGVTVTDVDSTSMGALTVRIVGPGAGTLQAPDMRTVGLPLGVYSGATRTLTIPATHRGGQQEMLKRVIFTPSRANLVDSRWSLEIIARDDQGALSASAIREVDVTAVRVAPAVTVAATPLAWAEGAGAAYVDDALGLVEDDGRLVRADVLTSTYAPSPGVTQTWDAATATFTFTFSSQVSEATVLPRLRGLRFEAPGTSVVPGRRTVVYTVTDDDGETGTASRAIDVTATP